MYIVLFVVFFNLRRWIFFASVNSGLNSLNRVRICAGIPYSAPRDLQKQDRVIARFSCYSTKKYLDIVRFAKSCQYTIFWLIAYGAVLVIRPVVWMKYELQCLVSKGKPALPTHDRRKYGTTFVKCVFCIKIFKTTISSCLINVWSSLVSKKLKKTDNRNLLPKICTRQT